jgi:hypothetical protein
MLYEMSIQRHKVSSHPSPPPFFPLFCICVYMKNRFWKLADGYKCAQTVVDIIPTPPLSLCIGGG